MISYNRFNHFFLWLLAVLILQGCTSPGKKYLDDALDTIQKHALNAKKVDWNEFNTRLHDEKEKVQTIEEAYPFIDYALWSLHDNHSFFIPDVERRDTANDRIPVSKDFFKKRLINESIGYLKILGFHCTDSNLSIVFSKYIQEEIQALDSNTLRGWVIDLRGNTGGNMWPMFSGLGPILGEGIAGYFYNPADNKYFHWTYLNGSVACDGEENVKIDSPYTLKNKDKKIAVLTDGLTASSGEAIVVAFKGLPNIRFFGLPTFGVSTSNKGFYLSDSSIIILTVSKFADRNKTVYGEKIDPDEFINDTAKVINRAVEWIEEPEVN